MKLYILFGTIIFIYTINSYANNEAIWVGNTIEGLPCNGGEQGFGPFDYTSAKQRNELTGGSKNTNLSIVEHRHFTSNVENLVKGETSSTPEGDLNYTLRAWPNHHRALLSIIKYQLNITNGLMKGKLNTPPECYLQRAIHFSPNDSISYSLYAYYMKSLGKNEEAVKYYQIALKKAPNNSKIAYSYSLLLIELKRYDEALEYAKIAYSSGQAPKALREKLQKLKVWDKNGEDSVSLDN